MLPSLMNSEMQDCRFPNVPTDKIVHERLPRWHNLHSMSLVESLDVSQTTRQ